jgi:hypothetical protein
MIDGKECLARLGYAQLVDPGLFAWTTDLLMRQIVGATVPKNQ